MIPIKSPQTLIDIGTNSVKMLVADLSSSSITPILDCTEQTRLGEGFYAQHLLQPEAIRRTTATVARFVADATALKTTSIRIIATSAARDASNSTALIDAVRLETGLEIQIISGEREAEWSFSGATFNPTYSTHQRLVLDVGGGSTEFIIGTFDQIRFRHSFEIGSVRLLEHLSLPQSPDHSLLLEARSFLDNFIQSQILPVVKDQTAGIETAVGVGGSTAILAMIDEGLKDFDRERIEAKSFTLLSLEKLVELLWSLPLKERQCLTGLPPERADVILTGAVIYESILRALSPLRLGISTRGLRFGALRHFNRLP